MTVHFPNKESSARAVNTADSPSVPSASNRNTSVPVERQHSAEQVRSELKALQKVDKFLSSNSEDGVQLALQVLSHSKSPAGPAVAEILNQRPPVNGKLEDSLRRDAVISQAREGANQRAKKLSRFVDSGVDPFTTF